MIKSKNNFVIGIAVFAMIWSIVQIIWIIIVPQGIFFTFITVFFLLMFYMGWYRIMKNTSYVGISIINLLDIAYTILLFFITTYHVWPQIIDVVSLFHTIVFWILAASLGLFNLLMLIYILISQTPLGTKAMKSYIWKDTYKAKQIVENKKNMLNLHEIANKIMCVDVSHIFPGKEENVYYATILAKDPIDLAKIQEAEVVLALQNHEIIAAFIFKPNQANCIEITESNLESIKAKFQSKLINDKQIGKYILNVSKQENHAFTSFVSKTIDITNKSECFYNF